MITYQKFKIVIKLCLMKVILLMGYKKIPKIISLVHLFTLFYQYMNRLNKRYVQIMLVTELLTYFVFVRSASLWCLYNIWSIVFLFKKI